MKEQEELSENTKNLQPKKISSRHRALMRRLIAGMTLQEASQELEYNLARASVIVNSPLFKEEMEKMQGEINRGFVDAESTKIHTDIVRKRFDELAPAAVDRLGEELVNSESGNVRVSAAKEILDRAGYVKKEVIKADVYVEPSQALLDVLNRMKEDDKPIKPGDGKTETAK